MIAAGKRFITHPSRTDEIRIWNLSDLHLMSKACSEDAIRRDVQEIRDDPHSFFLGGGDYCDFIGYSDKRFDPDSVADWVSVSDLGRLGEVGMRRIRDLFEPIKHKCLGLLMGNHEKQYALRTDHENLHGWLCTELGVPDLGYCCFMDIVFRRQKGQPTLSLSAPPGKHTSQTFRIFAHHGAGYAQTPGGKLNRLIQFMHSFDADVYFCGHVHDQVGRRQIMLTADSSCGKLTQRERLGVISGSYLRTYAQNTCTYGEQRGYAPVSLGAAWVAIHPETGKMRGEI